MLASSNATSDFEAIFAEFHPKVLRYLSGMIGPVEAEDVAQNVFMKAHAGLKNFRGEASLATWIFRIATNAAFDRLRNSSFRQTERLGSEMSDDSAIETATAELADKARSADSAFIRSEMNECIKTYVDALPENYRAVLVLSEFEELKNQDIAEILGLSVDAVKIRLHRARRELKQRFEANCEIYRSEDDAIVCDKKLPVCSASS